MIMLQGNKLTIKLLRMNDWISYKLIVFCILLLFFIPFLGGISLIINSYEENILAAVAFDKTSPDVIVVYTGDNGRIPYAIKMAKKFSQSNLFITGVSTTNTIDTLTKHLNIEGHLDPSFFKIDHVAQNTVENAISTLSYLRKHREMKEVLIISHDYHILRIKLIMDKMKKEGDDFKLHYIGIRKDYLQLRNLKILIKETFKFIGAYVFVGLGLFHVFTFF